MSSLPEASRALRHSMNIKGSLPILAPLVIGIILGWLVRGVPSIDGDDTAAIETPRQSRPGADQSDGVRMGSGRTPSHDVNSEALEDNDESFLVESDDVIRLIGSKIKLLEERTQLIHPDHPLEQVIGVTKNEAEQLNELWNRLKPALVALRADNVVHQELEGGGIWFGVEPFPGDGEALRKEFLLTTIKTLGEARARVFLNALSAHQAFGQWGKSIGSGFAVHTFVQDDDSIIYEIYEDSLTAGKPGRKWNSSTIPPHLKKLLQSSQVELPGTKPDQ